MERNFKVIDGGRNKMVTMTTLRVKDKGIVRIILQQAYKEGRAISKQVQEVYNFKVDY